MPENSKKMTTLRQIARPKVVVLAYDGLCTFEFGVAVEIFGLPRPELGDDWYRFAVASVDDGELRATGGIRIITDGDLSLLASADLIVVPGWRGVDSPVPDALRGKVQFSGRTPKEVLDDLARQNARRVYLDGGQVIQSFLREGLVADMVITTVPVLLGSGKSLFGALPGDIDLTLVSSRSFPSGLVQSHYRVTT